MNKIIYPIINFFLKLVKDFFGTLCGVKIWKWRPFKWACRLRDSINFIPCIVVSCPFDDGYNYAPGCDRSSKGFDAACEEGSCPTYYPGDSFGHSGIDCGLGDCIAFEMARTLNLFQFDFYNDWVNGSLFSYLLKYKRRKNKSEKFCESNCDDIAGGGVDGNGNGIADNNCYGSVLMDTCFRSGPDSHKNTRSASINEGLIKKVDNEFYYAATTKDTNLRLFATELVNLGSIFECDWQGIPKIQKQLIPTSFKVPPDTQELTDDQKVVETSGMVDIGGNTCGNFFDINCLGLHVDSRQCINVRHICEMGVDVDQTEFSLLDNNTILNQADCIISSVDIDDNFGKWFRDVFYGLNKSSTPWVGLNSLSIPSGGYLTDFNLAKNPAIGDYNQVSPTENGADYVSFRNISVNHAPVSDNSFGQPDHSYYFYFGLEPGNTGLDKMNKKFFASCIKPQKDDILIESNSIPDNLNMGTGCTIFSFIGGVGPFTYTITGLNDPQGKPLNITPIIGTVSVNTIDTKVCNLSAGTYLISAIDSLGTPVSDTVGVNGPTPLYCYSYVSKMLTHDYDSDGAITIANVGGGKGSINYELKNSQGTTISGPAPATSNLVLGGLANDLVGYTLRIYDESVPVTACTTTGLTITGPSTLILSYTGTNVHCYGENSGQIALKIQGGVSPYTTTVVGQDYTASGLLATGLLAGQYTVTVVDAIGSAKTQTVNIIDENPELIILKPTIESDISTQCDVTQYKIPFDITAGVSSGNVNVEYSVDTGDTWIANPLQYTGGRYILNVPRTSVNSTDGVIIRFWVDAIVHYDTDGTALPPCYSDELVYEVSEMTLPPDIGSDPYIKDGLGTSYTPALEAIYHNLRQCNSDKGTYTFSIAALDRGFTYRAPYTIEYRVESVNAASTTITHYTGLVTLEGIRNINAQNTTDNKVDFYVKITDNKGCVYPTSGWHQATVQLPSVTMSCEIKTGGSFPNYTHALKVDGGIAPLRLGGVGVINAGQWYTYTNSNLVYVNTVTDKNGCVVNIIG